jgi:hypothetical protein
VFVTESLCFVTIAGSIGVFVTESVRFVTIVYVTWVFVTEFMNSVTITGSAVLFVTESDCFVTIATGSFGENDKSPPGTGARRGFMFLGRGGVTCF